MYQLVEPFISDIVVALFGLITAIVLAMFAELRKRVLLWIDSRNELRNQEILRNITEDAFSYIEQTMKNESSQRKFNEAVIYVSDKIESKGLKVNHKEISAAIEREVLKFNNKSTVNEINSNKTNDDYKG